MLKEAGAERVPEGPGWRKMLCPFHEDTNPSAAVNHTLEAFICHSCGVSGDAVKLIRDHWGKTYQESLQFARELGAARKEEIKSERRSRRLH